MSKIITTQGIVFKSLKYSESSLILDIYTLELGLRSYIVSGVRKAKSKISMAMYQPGQILELTAYNKEGNKLNRIKEAHLAIKDSSVKFDVLRSMIIVYMIDISRNSIKEQESNPELYFFLKNSIVNLKNGKKSLAQSPLIFTIELASFLGFGIIDNYDADLCSLFDLESGQFISSYNDKKATLNHDVSFDLNTILKGQTDHKISKQNRTLLQNALIKYYKLHVESMGELKSLEVLRQVLS